MIGPALFLFGLVNVPAAVAAHGPRVAESSFSIGWNTHFQADTTTYGPNLTWRSDGGFLLGLGIHPGHQERGPRAVELGVGASLDLGYGFELARLPLGDGQLRLGASLRAFSFLGTGALDGLALGGAVATALGFAGPKGSGLDAAQVFVEYRPVVGTLEQSEPTLHGLRLGGLIVFDPSGGPGPSATDRGPCVLFGAAVERASLLETEGTALTVEVGLVL